MTTSLSSISERMFIPRSDSNRANPGSNVVPLHPAMRSQTDVVASGGHPFDVDASIPRREPNQQGNPQYLEGLRSHPGRRRRVRLNRPSGRVPWRRFSRVLHDLIVGDGGAWIALVPVMAGANRPRPATVRTPRLLPATGQMLWVTTSASVWNSSPPSLLRIQSTLALPEMMIAMVSSIIFASSLWLG